MKILAGWVLTITGLTFMIGFGITTILSLWVLFSGEIDFVWPLLYAVATVGFFTIWKYGGKLRNS